MAETNILSISLKDYKKQIDDLKGSLLGLEKGSKEYEQVLQEVRDRQNKLNSVLSDTKSSSKAAANSMAEMKEQLKQMKAEANNLDVGSTRFKELSQQILETTNKLKTLEESQGTFSRNVGNYAGGVIDAFNKMGVSVGSLQGAFNIATQAGGAFNTILTTLKAHPIVAALTILLGIIMKVKDSISNSEQATRGWEKAMSAFQPIMDLFNRLLEKVALVLVDIVDWIGKHLPTAFNFCGTVVNKFATVLGGLAKIGVNVAGTLVRAYTQTFKFIADGVSELANKTASVLEYIPGIGEGVANSIKTAGNGIKGFASNVDNTVKTFISNATSGIDNLVSKITTSVSSVTNGYAAAVKERRKISEDQFKLEDNMRAQQSAAAESELKQAQLRDKIATASGKERIELLKQLRAEIETNGKREVEIAKEQLRLAKTVAALGPNTKADNERIAQLEANVIKTEANYQASFARIDKMQANTEKKMTATAKKEAAERTKAEKEAAAEQEKIAREAIQRTKLTLETSAIAYSSTIKQETDAYKTLKDEHSKDTDAMTQHLENAKTLRIQQINEQIAAYESLLATVTLSDNQQIELTNTISKLTQQKTDDVKQYDEELKKVALDRLEILAQERQSAIDTDERIQYLAKEYANLYANLSPDDVNFAVAALDVSDEVKQKILSNYSLLYDDIKNNTTKFAEELEAERHENNLLELKNTEEHLLSLHELGLISEEDFNDKMTQLHIDAENEDLRHAKAQEDVLKQNEKKTKEHAKRVAAIYQQMSGTISNVLNAVASNMEKDIKAKQENGEITEEEAKKQFETVKALQIASATIDMISGAVQAYSVAQSLGPIAGPIVGGINAAAVTAMGIANIAQIKSQQWKGSSNASVSTGDGAASRATSNIDFSGVRVNPLLDENADLNRMTTLSEQQPSEQRVYILQSDIADSQKQVQIRQSNTTF